MPLRRWLEDGLTVGLGTDVGAGPSLSLWAEAAFACTASKLLWSGNRNLLEHLKRSGTCSQAQQTELSKALTLDAPVDPVQAFHLATLGGARALGLDDCIGTLAAGKDADFVVVDPRLVDPAECRAPEAPERTLSRMLYREHPGMVRATYIRGRKCFAAQG